MQENFEAAAEVLAGVAGASMQMGGEVRRVPCLAADRTTGDLPLFVLLFCCFVSRRLTLWLPPASFPPWFVCARSQDMMGQDPNVHVMGMGADGGMGGVPGQDGGEHQQQWEMHQAPPPLTDGEHVGVAADASGVVADAGGVAAAGAEQGAAEGAVDMNAVGVAPAE